MGVVFKTHYAGD